MIEAMNRIESAIDAQQKNIDDRLAKGLVTQDKLDALHSALDLSLDEFVKFQELKSLMTANQVLTLDEGNLIYKYLGSTPSYFNKQSLAVKVTLTSVFKEILLKQMR